MALVAKTTIYGKLELEVVIASKDLLDLHWWKQSSTRYNHRHQQVGNPQGKPRGQSQSQETSLSFYFK